MDIKDWNTLAKKHLKGCKIVTANWQTPKTAKMYGWDRQGLEIVLQNKSGEYYILTVMQDDEGNGPGALLLESHQTKIVENEEGIKVKVPKIEEVFPVQWD